MCLDRRAITSYSRKDIYGMLEWGDYEWNKCYTK